MAARPLRFEDTNPSAVSLHSEAKNRAEDRPSAVSLHGEAKNHAEEPDQGSASARLSPADQLSSQPTNLPRSASTASLITVSKNPPATTHSPQWRVDHTILPTNTSASSASARLSPVDPLSSQQIKLHPRH
jgi:hypothetical protein